MPLYDYHCAECSTSSTLLMKSTDLAQCPACGSAKMEKLLAPFATLSSSGAGVKEGVPAAPRKGYGASNGHTHSAACGSGCGAGAQADALVKKYLG